MNKIESQKTLSSRLSQPKLEKAVVHQSLDHSQSMKVLARDRFAGGQTGINEGDYDRIVNNPKFRIHNFCRYDLDKVKDSMFGKQGEKFRVR